MSPASDTANVLNAEQQALLDAVGLLLEPLAQLCLAKGVTIQSLEERLRQAVVQSALQTHLGLQQKIANDASKSASESRRQTSPRSTAEASAGARLTSRVSASTGLTRREVARLISERAPKHAGSASAASEVFTRWVADSTLRSASGDFLPLPRVGAAPSFEALAQSVTRDVHPRSLLDELTRLKIVSWDREKDIIRLERAAFVPDGDWARMIAFLGDNVGDHLRAATANVLGDGQKHLEQAIFADKLSEQSLQSFSAVMRAQWQTLLQSLAPELEKLIAEDEKSGRIADQRLRIGLYTWSQNMQANPNSQSVSNALTT